jgi:choline dehydrogenase-like flavoprotein
MMTNVAKFDLDDNDVVVIIGSGAGGGTVANELAQKGVKSVVLEAGKRFTLEDIKNSEWEMFMKLSWLDKRISAGGWHHAKNHTNLPAWICKGVGGSSIHWAGVSLRFKPHEFKMKSTNGAIEGANVADWPITYEELEPYYDKAEDKMGVTGTKATGTPDLPESSHTKLHRIAAERTGMTFSNAPMAINSVARDGRPACQQIGFCMQGCRIGAKWSTMYTEIPKAESTGLCEIRPNSMVLKIEHDDSGKAIGVHYVDENGNKKLQKARIVCVAGNSIESPRLLLNSASEKFPNGLANSSGQVGRNYMGHTTGGVYGVFPKPVNMHRGTSVPSLITSERDNNPERGFVAGYSLEVLTLGLGFLSAFLKPGTSGWGREISEALENYKNMAGVWICGEDLPVESNRITLHPTEKDQHGLPVPVITKTDHNNDIVMRNHAYAQTAKLYKSVGAIKLHNLPAYPNSHNMGTNRMSEKPSDGVVNKWGQSHDVPNLFISDGSQFVTSASVNPTLTIVALAIRQAEYIEKLIKTDVL